ncbi:MAG: tetratricopeptide repeat protein, partial [Phycisphaeraceae bacterium]|nr:tetratricopeptide repeat protein [Phycisphaeraceae bacterium]
ALDVGSVRYMAPELFDEDPVDQRCDLYALGIIAYEMFAGRDGFEEAFRIVLRDQRNQALRWMKWHTNQRAKATPLTELNEDVDPNISALIERLMEKDPAQRVESAHQVIDALRRHFSGEPAAPAAGDTPPAGAATDDVSATAPLPETNRLPVVIGAASLSAMVLIVLLLVGLQQYRTSTAYEQRRSQAIDRFQIARDDLKEGYYDDAIKTFVALARAWPDDKVLGDGARARAWYARGLQQMEAENWEQARQAMQEAGSLNQLSPDLIHQQIREINQRAAFDKEVEQITSYIEQGRYGAARQRLLAQEDLRLTDEETERLEQLGQRIEDQQKQEEVDDLIKRAEGLEAAGDRAGAIAALQEGLEEYQTGSIRRLLLEMQRRRQHAAALQRGTEAEAAGDLAQAVSAYKQALEIRPDEDLEQKTRQLQAELAYRRGREHQRGGRLDEARAAFRTAIGLSGHEPARDALAEIDELGRFESLVAAGNQAMEAGNYDAAIDQFRKALKVREDVSVASRLNEAQIQRRLQRADRALRNRNIDAARGLYQEVLELDPENRLATTGLEQVAKWDQYAGHLARGDRYRRESRFGEAKLEYSRAADIFNTDEIQQRKTDIEYESLIAAAQADIAAEQWESAYGYLQAARSVRRTDQVDRLLMKVADYVLDSPE